VLEGAALASKASEAAGEGATRDEVAELALDEGGQTVAAGAAGDLLQEGLEVLAHDAVQNTVLGRARAVVDVRPGRLVDALRRRVARHGRRRSAIRAGRERTRSRAEPVDEARALQRRVASAA